MILSFLESDVPGTSTTRAFAVVADIRFAGASNAVSSDKTVFRLRKRIPEIRLTTISLLHSAVLELRKCRSNRQ